MSDVNWDVRFSDAERPYVERLRILDLVMQSLSDSRASHVEGYFRNNQAGFGEGLFYPATIRLTSRQYHKDAVSEIDADVLRHMNPAHILRMQEKAEKKLKKDGHEMSRELSDLFQHVWLATKARRGIVQAVGPGFIPKHLPRQHRR